MRLGLRELVTTFLVPARRHRHGRTKSNDDRLAIEQWACRHKPQVNHSIDIRRTTVLWQVAVAENRAEQVRGAEASLAFVLPIVIERSGPRRDRLTERSNSYFMSSSRNGSPIA